MCFSCQHWAECISCFYFYVLWIVHDKPIVLNKRVFVLIFMCFSYQHWAECISWFYVCVLKIVHDKPIVLKQRVFVLIFCVFHINIRLNAFRVFTFVFWKLCTISQLHWKLKFSLGVMHFVFLLLCFESCDDKPVVLKIRNTNSFVQHNWFIVHMFQTRKSNITKFK